MIFIIANYWDDLLLLQLWMKNNIISYNNDNSMFIDITTIIFSLHNALTNVSPISN